MSPGRPAAPRRSHAVAPLWTNRHELGARRAQTRAPRPASVTAEGGGTAHPTLGGGFWFSREHGPVGGEVGEARAGRLLAPDEGAHEDVDGPVAEDEGIDGGAASAEEAAVHVIDDEEG